MVRSATVDIKQRITNQTLQAQVHPAIQRLVTPQTRARMAHNCNCQGLVMVANYIRTLSGLRCKSKSGTNVSKSEWQRSYRNSENSVRPFGNDDRHLNEQRSQTLNKLSVWNENSKKCAYIEEDLDLMRSSVSRQLCAAIPLTSKLLRAQIRFNASRYEPKRNERTRRGSWVQWDCRSWR